MTYIGTYGVDVAWALSMVLLGIILGLLASIFAASREHPVKTWIIIVMFVTGCILTIIGISVASHCKYVIRVDNDITVAELTDKFIVHRYDSANDLWIVSEKRGGISPKDLKEDK